MKYLADNYGGVLEYESSEIVLADSTILQTDLLANIVSTLLEIKAMREYFQAKPVIPIAALHQYRHTIMRADSFYDEYFPQERREMDFDVVSQGYILGKYYDRDVETIARLCKSVR